MQINKIYTLTEISLGGKKIHLLVINGGEFYEVIGIDIIGVYTLAQCDTLHEAQHNFYHHVAELTKYEQNKAKQL